MSDAPEAYCGVDSRPTHEAYKEVVTQVQTQGLTGGKDEVTKAAKPFEIRGTSFWIIVVLTILLISAIIGGAVGGSVAVRNAKCKSTSPMPCPTASMEAPTNTNTVRIPSPKDTQFLTTACPPNGIVTTYDEKYYFRCEERMEYSEGDVIAYLSYTFEQCIEACIKYGDMKSEEDQCVAVEFSKDLAAAYENGRANCWVKVAQGLRKDTGNANQVALTRCKDAECNNKWVK
jgi:hypothetical protein